jgi:hypothetical protein
MTPDPGMLGQRQEILLTILPLSPWGPLKIFLPNIESSFRILGFRPLWTNTQKLGES